MSAYDISESIKPWPRHGHAALTGYMHRPVQPVSVRVIRDVVPPVAAVRPVSKPDFRALLDRNAPEHAITSTATYASQPGIPSTPVSLDNLSAIKTPSRRWRMPRDWLRLVSYGLAGICLLLGGYLGFTSWRANQAVLAQAAILTKQANTTSQQATTTTTAALAATAALSTVKPTTAQADSYTVAPDAPRYLTIPSLGVHARVLALGLTSRGAVATPSNVYDTAWYTGSAKPGTAGATLIDGHVSSWTSRGVFYDLKSLKPGDVIQVEEGDGRVLTYRVVTSRVYDADNVDMSAALSPVMPGKVGLNLITCTGDVLPGTGEFAERIVVFATLGQ